MKNNITSINKSVSNVLGQLKGKVNTDFINDLKYFFDNIEECLRKKDEFYNQCKEKGMSEYEAQREERRMWENRYSEKRVYKSFREKITFREELKDCIDRQIIKDGMPGDLNSNSYEPLNCAKTIIVHAAGSWKFNKSNFSQNLISWWLHCFNKNRNTAIISESWDPPKFNIFKSRFIQNYIRGGNHEVVFLIYDEVDGFTLKFPQ